MSTPMHAAAVRPTIRTPDQRLRVFVSSTLGELAPERAAAQAAIESLQLTPVLFELGARPHAPRALYRAYLEQSDIFVAVYWQRYGWVAPDMDISGLEDEYRLSVGMPRLVYLKRPAPDIEPGLAALIDDLQDDGTVSYRPFTDAGELQQLLAQDLAVLLSERFAAHDAGRDTGWQAPPPPTPSTPLIGREADVRALLEVLGRDGTRLVTLTGAGGVGKTRLAIAALEHAAHRRPNRAFVDLSAVTDAAQVPMAVAAHLGVVPEGRQAPLDALIARLASAEALLVLDNFEQVTDAAPALATLLHACPGVSLVVTSRTVLHLRGEVEWPVHPLPTATSTSFEQVVTSPAVRLLVARIQAVRPSFELTEANAGDIARLAARLDGLPLALELAAAQLRLAAPGALLRRLDERRDLTAAYADLPERQRSLSATLDWSHELLTPRQRALFARFSVFAGGCDLDAAAAVCDVEGAGDALEVISALVECSLVTVQDVGGDQLRLRMLETVRQYASERLEERDDSVVVHHRLLAHLAEFVARADAAMVGEGGSRLWMARVDAETDNIKTATDWALRHGHVTEAARLNAPLWLYWWIRGHSTWVTSLGERVRSLTGEQPPAEVAMEVAWLHGGAYFMRGLHAEALPHIREAADHARRSGMEEALGWCLAALGTCLTKEQDYTDARATLQEAVEIFGRLELPLGRGYAASHLGDILLVDGDVAGAIAVHQDCLRIARTTGSDHLTAQALCHLGFDHLVAGELEGARAHLAEAGEVFRSLRNADGIVYCLAGLSGVAHQQDHHEAAARLLGATAAIRRTLGLGPWPLMAQLEEGIAAGVRVAVGADAFDAATAAGAALSPGAALDYALQATRSGEPTAATRPTADTAR